MLNLALVQFRPQKGNVAANLARLQAVLGQISAATPRADVVVFPETALTGYFLEGGVRDLALPAAALYDQLQAAYTAVVGADAPLLDILIGFYERYQARYYNSAMYATLGAGQTAATSIAYVHRKVFLPTYGVFDEARFVEHGRTVAAFDTRFGRAAILICEDVWHSMTGLMAALDGAQIVFVPSASPARGSSSGEPDNLRHWEKLLTNLSSEHGIYTVVAHLTGFEGGKGFAGGSLVVGPRGNVEARGPTWQEVIVNATVDLRDLHLVRADLPLLADAETMLPHLAPSLMTAGTSEHRRNQWLEISAQGAVSNSQGVVAGAQGLTGDAPPVVNEEAKREARADRTALAALTAMPALEREVGAENRELVASAAVQPQRAPAVSPLLFPVVAAPRFAPEDDSLLRLAAAATVNWLLAFLRDEVTLRRGFRKVVLGLSGGVDSALVAYLAARAFGPQNVLAIRMPYRTSSQDSLDHAQIVVDDLGIECETIPITDAVDGYLRHAEDADGRRRGNIMARQRMITLFDQSAKHNCIVLGTGNKTERMFGYYTWHADDSPPVNALGDLWKTQVWQLSEHIGVPTQIIHKPASADLVVGQTDESDFGISYRKADRILHFLLQGYTATRLVELGFAEQEVAIVVKRVSTTHWKRHLPSVAMLSSTAIGEYYLRPVDY